MLWNIPSSGSCWSEFGRRDGWQNDFGVWRELVLPCLPAGWEGQLSGKWVKGWTTFRKKRGILFDRYIKESDFDYRSYKKVQLQFSEKERFSQLLGPCSYKTRHARPMSSRRGGGETYQEIPVGTKECLRAAGICKGLGLQIVEIRGGRMTECCARERSFPTWHLFSTCIKYHHQHYM